MNRSSSKKIRLFFFTIALPVLMALIAHEVYVRATEEPVDLYTLTGRASGKTILSPMSEWALTDAFCAYRCIPGKFSAGKWTNSLGFMSTPEITVDKPEGTVRIVFLGGSSTVGTGLILRDELTWPWLAVEMTRGGVQTPVDFINGAVGGFTSFESYGRLWSRIRHFSPDIVVVYHGWNEMYYFERADHILSWRTKSDGTWSFVSTKKPPVIYPPHWIDPMIRWSQSLTQIRLSLSRPNEGEVGPAPESPLRTDFNRAGLPIWRTNLQLIREACTIIGAKLFVVKQATLIVPGLPAEERERCKYELHGFDHDTHLEAYSEIYRVIDEEIPRDGVIDVTSISGRAELFNDHVHPTAAGAHEIASIISKSLISHINSLADSKRQALPPTIH